MMKWCRYLIDKRKGSDLIHDLLYPLGALARARTNLFSVPYHEVGPQPMAFEQISLVPRDHRRYFFGGHAPPLQTYSCEHTETDVSTTNP